MDDLPSLPRTETPAAPYRIALSADDSDADRSLVLNGLFQFNTRFMGPDDARKLTVLVRDADGAIRGGLLGWTYWHALGIDILWLDDALRGQGLGSRVMALAEAEAVARGCTFAHVDTMSFQALDFYRKLGYSAFGTLQGYASGVERHYLRKDLPAPAAP